MAVVKKNTYIIGDNATVSNLVLNTAKPHFDKTYITYSAPNILIKVGSLIECNGSLYAVETSDVSLTAAVGNLCFNSNTLTFSISTSAFTYDPVKRGDYADANTVVCKWKIISGNLIHNRLDSFFGLNPSIKTLSYDVVGNASVSGIQAFLDDVCPLVGQKVKATGGVNHYDGAPSKVEYFFIISFIERVSTSSLYIHGVKKTHSTVGDIIQVIAGDTYSIDSILLQTNNNFFNRGYYRGYISAVDYL
jgi:hypothetical protein